MATSEARTRANKANAALSTGPKTAEGKEKSRRNSLKHGLTGAGVVLIEADEAEVARRTVTYGDELMAIGEVGQAVARRAALNSVRMERAAEQQVVALKARVRQVEADFVAPDDVDDAEAEKLRDEAVRIALFDPSKEATLARQYETTAERSFYKALKQLRQMELQAEKLLKEEADEANQVARHQAMMASFSKAERVAAQEDAEFDELYASLNMPRERRFENPAHPAQVRKAIDVPMTIGRG